MEDVGGGARKAIGELGTGAGRAVQDVGRGAGAAVQDVGHGAGRAVEGVGGEVYHDVTVAYRLATRLTGQPEGGRGGAGGTDA
ncbi:hypothetical protein ACFW2D_21870 [Streptomyces sp. NPDC058914]|uniref:hypothetical protein n=1 Tax=Streptomyces TaxID=1883 RepID=UPI0036A6A9B5